LNKIFLIIFFIIPFIGLNQERDIYIELGGSGGLGSINYEKKIGVFGGQGTISYSAGFSLTPIDKNNGTVLIFPLLFHTMIGQAHKAEFAMGQSFSITTKGQFFLKTPLFLGYLYHKEDKPFLFRAGYSPIINNITQLSVQHWGGLSFGYAF
jgi:hypothetical protein